MTTTKAMPTTKSGTATNEPKEAEVRLTPTCPQTTPTRKTAPVKEAVMTRIPTLPVTQTRPPLTTPTPRMTAMARADDNQDATADDAGQAGDDDESSEDEDADD